MILCCLYNRCFLKNSLALSVWAVLEEPDPNLICLFEIDPFALMTFLFYRTYALTNLTKYALTWNIKVLKIFHFWLKWPWLLKHKFRKALFHQCLAQILAVKCVSPPSVRKTLCYKWEHKTFDLSMRKS